MQVSYCIFHGNSTEDLSGALYYYQASGFVSNNTFYGNSSDNVSYGAAVVIDESPGVTVERNIISNQLGGYGLAILDEGIVHSCNIFWSNGLGSIHGDGLAPDELVADPMFCNAANNYFAIYHDSPAAAPNSPCGQLIGARAPACGGTVPVAITFFDAAPVGDNVQLTWEIAGDEDPLGFKLYRKKLPNGSMEILNNDMILQSHLRSFGDNTIEAGKTYEYRLGILLSGQSEMFSAPVTVTMRNFVFALERNIPNPFNPTTTIPYSIGEAGHVLLQIYDVRGNLVKTLVDENQSTGRYKVVWDAGSSNGVAVASGVYFVQLKAQGAVSTQKMMLLK
jgi:hypothetical protein